MQKSDESDGPSGSESNEDLVDENIGDEGEDSDNKDSESESGEEAKENRNLSDLPSKIQAIYGGIREYSRATEAQMANCRELCKSCSLEEAMEHYAFFVSELKKDSATDRQRRGQKPMNPHKATHRARKTIDDVLRGCYGQAFDDKRAIQKKEQQQKRIPRPKRYTKKYLLKHGCRHSGICYENPNCSNWYHKIQCPPNCLKGDACRNVFLSKKTPNSLVFGVKLRVRLSSEPGSRNVVYTESQIDENHLIGMLPARPALTPEEEKKSFFAVRFPANEQGTKQLKDCVFLEPKNSKEVHIDLMYIQSNPVNPNCGLEGWRMRFNDDGSSEFRILVKAKRMINAGDVLSVNFGKGFLSEAFTEDASSTEDASTGTKRPSYGAGSEGPTKEARIDTSMALICSPSIPVSVPVLPPDGNLFNIGDSVSLVAGNMQQPIYQSFLNTLFRAVTDPMTFVVSPSLPASAPALQPAIDISDMEDVGDQVAAPVSPPLPVSDLGASMALVAVTPLAKQPVATVTPASAATEERTIPESVFRRVLKNFMKPPLVDVVVREPENYKTTIPEEPFGLKREFWTEILQCMSSTKDEAYTMMLYQEDLVVDGESYDGFFDYFTDFGALLSDHFAHNDDAIHFEDFCDCVKKTLPLILGSKKDKHLIGGIEGTGFCSSLVAYTAATHLNREKWKQDLKVLKKREWKAIFVDFIANQDFLTFLSNYVESDIRIIPAVVVTLTKQIRYLREDVYRRISEWDKLPRLKKTDTMYHGAVKRPNIPEFGENYVPYWLALEDFSGGGDHEGAFYSKVHIILWAELVTIHPDKTTSSSVNLTNLKSNPFDMYLFCDNQRRRTKQSNSRWFFSDLVKVFEHSPAHSTSTSAYYGQSHYELLVNDPKDVLLKVQDVDKKGTSLNCLEIMLKNLVNKMWKVLIKHNSEKVMIRPGF